MPAPTDSLDLSALNPQQREAVTLTEGPLLVLAGAGSGKTRVITTRLAYLMAQRQVPPERILAMTFTNKAAREMNERVGVLVAGLRGRRRGQRPTIGTFHAFGVQLLRAHVERLGLGYRSDFVIYDEQDQRQVVRDILEQMDNQAHFTARSALYALQSAKAAGLGPAELEARRDAPAEVLLGAIYREYQETLRAMNAIDFEDILQLSLQLAREQREAAAGFFGRYRYVMVDEYQDTNRVQYDLLREIVRGHGNVCVVGDDDQSIYGWRGAEPGNLLRFERDFPGARVIRLEQNYRSTDTILAAANQVIARNPGRKPKTLRGLQGPGRPLEWILGETETDEMEKVVTHLKLTRMRTGAPYSDFAVLYRSNHQSRAVEEQLREEGIPYTLVGGTRFYDRKEIKDAVAYLRLLRHPTDEVSLFRVINFPRRGIGKASQIRLIELARRERRPCMDMMREAGFHQAFTGPVATAMERLAGLLDRYRRRFATGPLGDTFREFMAELGFHRAVEAERNDPKGRELARSLVYELEQSVALFERSQPGAGLKGYLERVALLSMPEDTREQRTPMVRLMTVHSAKGLEFPYLYLVGMAEDLFPHQRALQDGGEEEERRLAYVAITRACKHLVCSAAKARMRWGETIVQQPSRFLLEIDPALFDGVPPAADAEGAAGSNAAWRPARERKRANARRRFFDQVRKMKEGAG